LVVARTYFQLRSAPARSRVVPEPAATSVMAAD
jgi:hypothetical protein